MNISRLHVLTLLSMCGGAVAAHGAYHSSELLSPAQCNAHEHTLETIKRKVGILIITIVEEPSKLHPRNALRLLIVLMEKHLAIERRRDIEEFYLLLQSFMQQDLSDAQAILCTLTSKAPTDILPEEVAQKLQTVSNPQKLKILAAFKIHTYKNKNPQDNIDYLEEMVFSRS